MIALPEWHPMAVHFPLALTVTAALVLSAARAKRLERYGATLGLVGTWNLCLGAAGVLLALGTGLAAVVSLDLAPAARAAVALHVRWAILRALPSCCWRCGAAREWMRRRVLRAFSFCCCGR